MEDQFVCPFCDVSRKEKTQIDFHLKYAHADIYPLMSEQVTKVDLEEKLTLLVEQKKILEKEIGHIKSIMEMKTEE